MTPELRDAYKIDRTGWAPGEWDEEPDRLDFRHKGMPCLLLRNTLGNWCGYVGVVPEHPLYGKSDGEPGVDLEVHGGITYANECAGNICHIPEPGEPDTLWWFGFDTAHCYDLIPYSTISHRQRTYDETYRTMDYARQQTERLAEQLKEIN